MMIKETATTCEPGESSPLDGMYTMTAEGNGEGEGKGGEGEEKRIREGGGIIHILNRY